MDINTLFETIDSLKDTYISFWEDICNIESPTEYKEGVDRVGNYFLQKAKQLGFETEVFPQPVSGDVVCITLNPNSANAPVCLSGHTDTVHPIGSFGTPAVRIEGDKMYGPAVTDCKGGIAAAFYAMHALKLCGYTDRPVMLLLQSDEENSSIFSNKQTINYICDKAKNAIAFLNCEGAKKDGLTLRRKGISRYVFEVKGKAMHSSNCFIGVSAVTEAAHKIIELEKLKDEHGLTCNCGLITGGTAENTVPETCTFTADIRFANKEQMDYSDDLVKKIAQKSYLEGTSCTVTLKSRRVAMEQSDKNDVLFKRINEIFSECGLEMQGATMSNGGSDAADVTACGIPCVDSIGVMGGYIHTLNEYARIPTFVLAAKRIAAITAKI